MSESRWRAFTDDELRAVAYSFVWHDNGAYVLFREPYASLMAEVQAEATSRGLGNLRARQFPALDSP